MSVLCRTCSTQSSPGGGRGSCSWSLAFRLRLENRERHATARPLRHPAQSGAAADFLGRTVGWWVGRRWDRCFGLRPSRARRAVRSWGRMPVSAGDFRFRVVAPGTRRLWTCQLILRRPTCWRALALTKACTGLRHVWNGAPNGIPYVVVGGDQRGCDHVHAYGDESDPGPYPSRRMRRSRAVRAPMATAYSGRGPRRMAALRAFSAYPDGAGGWKADSGAVFDLTSDTPRPAGWTSADAAGLPTSRAWCATTRRGVRKHRPRVALLLSSAPDAVRPAGATLGEPRHRSEAATDGTRVRLKADFDTSGFPELHGSSCWR